jgi:ribonuclease J
MSPAPAPAPAPRPFAPERKPEGESPRPFNRGGRGSAGRQGSERRRGGRGRGGRRPGAAARKIQRILRRPGANPRRAPQGAEYYPAAPAENVVRIVPLGGVEEVGRNMLAVDLNGDIFVSDVGFHFKEEGDAPGADYTLPNSKYLERNADRIRGIFITHGHLDHIGGLPFILPRIGNPPIYTRRTSAIMIAKRHEEYPDIPKPELVVVEAGQKMTIGHTKVKFFQVTHSIPDSMGISLETKYGNVVISGDLKLEHEDGVPTAREVATWGDLAKDTNLFFVADSTNAEREGFSMPERRVQETLEEIIKTVKGRLIIGTFASQFERMIAIIKAAEKYGKKVVMEGRSIKTNLEIAQKAGLLEVEKGTFIQAQEIQNYPPEKILVLATGAQGEEFAALMRIATKQHKYIQFSERDTIVLSSSVIPGNEISVQKLKDNLYRNKVSVIHYRSSDVHSTGHGNTGELVWMNKQVNSKFFMPGYGYYSMTYSHAKAVEQAGRARDTIVLGDNGSVIDIVDGERLEVHKQKVPSAPLVVDGFSIGDLQEVVMRDRQALAKDGMFVIIASVNMKTGKLRKSPDIISRGFVYLRESQNLLNEARLLIKKSIEDSTRNMNPIDLDYVKDNLADTMAGFLFQKTNKAPMVIPVLIGM